MSDLLDRAAEAQREAHDACASARTIWGVVRDNRRTSTGLLRRCYVAHHAAVPRARDAVTRLTEAARFPATQRGAVRRAVTEAVTNVVVHAYDGRFGLIHLTAAVSDTELIVLVADDGRGLKDATPGAGGGRGWALIAEATDEYTISQRATGGSLIEMRWR